jgi:hypothetical protein
VKDEDALKVEAICSSEMLVSSYESTLQNNAEDHRSYLNSAINGLDVAIFLFYE